MQTSSSSSSNPFPAFTFAASRAFVTANDRTFTCPNASCGDGDVGGGDQERHIGGDASGLVDLNAKFLDVDAIRANLSNLIGAVSEALADMLSWVDRLEHEFGLKYAANEITGNISLFNQLNTAIVKIKRMKSMLNRWLGSFHQLVLDTSELTNEYAIAVSVLRSEVEATDLALVQNAVALAKRNVSKSRSIAKRIKQLLRLDALIKTNLIKLRSQIESFYTGSVKVDDQMLSLNEFERTIRALSNDDTPLKQIQLSLANEINSRKQTFAVSSTQPEQIITPEENCVYGACPPDLDLFKLTDRLKTIRDSVLYTENTKAQLERVIDSAIALAKDTPRLPEIQRLANEIRDQTPAKTLNYYRMNVRTTDGQFTRMANIKRVIANLRGTDVTYGPILQSIHDEMAKELTNEIQEDTEMRE